MSRFVSVRFGNYRILPLRVTSVTYLVVACAGYISFTEKRHEEPTLEWWFVGSLTVLAIPVLAIAYILWDAYRVTMR